MKTIVPIKLLSIQNEGFHPIIKASVNGRTVKLVVDTGASKTVFDIQQVEKFINPKLFEKHDKLSTGLGTSSMESLLVTLKKMKIGDLIIANYKAVLMDLSHINESYAQMGFKPIDGILGSDVFYTYKAKIDFEKQVLHLKEKKKSNFLKK